MSYSYMICNDDVNKCHYNKIEINKYMDYLKTLPTDGDDIYEKGYEYVCGDNKKDTKLVECCDSNDTTVVNENVYVKKTDNGYKKCLCKTDNCRNKFCKDFSKASQYLVCKVRSTDGSKINNINNYVQEIPNDYLFPDCNNKCI